MASALLSFGVKEAAKAAGSRVGGLIAKEIFGLDSNGNGARLDEIKNMLVDIKRDISQLQATVEKGFMDLSMELFNNECDKISSRYDLYTGVLTDMSETKDPHLLKNARAQLINLSKSNATEMVVLLEGINTKLVGRDTPGMIKLVVRQGFTMGDLLRCYCLARYWLLKAVAYQTQGLTLLQWAAADKEAQVGLLNSAIQKVYNQLDAQEACFTRWFGPGLTKVCKCVLQQPTGFLPIGISTMTEDSRGAWVEPDKSYNNPRDSERLSTSKAEYPWALESREYRDSSQPPNLAAMYTFHLWDVKYMCLTQMGPYGNTAVWLTVPPRRCGWKLLPAFVEDRSDIVRIVYADEQMDYAGNGRVWTHAAHEMRINMLPSDNQKTVQLFQIHLRDEWNHGNQLSSDTRGLLAGVRLYSSNRQYYLEVSPNDSLPRVFSEQTRQTVWQMNCFPPPSGPTMLRVEEDPRPLAVARRSLNLRHPNMAANKQFWTLDITGSNRVASLELGDDGVLRMKAGNDLVWKSDWPAPVFTPVHTSSSGLANFDFKSPNDRAFAYDWDSTGKMDHIVMYRAGSGTIYIGGNDNWVWNNRFAASLGTAGFDLGAIEDRAMAFDYNSSGNMDHILFCRPGTGQVYIAKRDGNGFRTLYAESTGIGTFDMKSRKDRIIAFDYKHEKKMDHLVCYRPGSRTIYFVRNNKGKFEQAKAFGGGTFPYDLASVNDKIIAYDWEQSGKMDHLLAYRPGEGKLYIYRNNNGNFEPVFTSDSGVCGYDLRDASDRVLAFDYMGTGRSDHLIMYRRGVKNLWCLRRSGNGFEKIAAAEAGIGGFDLSSPDDRLFALDFDHSKQRDHLVAYRRNGGGTVWILRHLR